MSLLDIVEAANDLAALLERAARRGLKHPKHAQHVAPARKRIKDVMAHYFRRQEKAVLAAVKPHIERQLMLHPPPIREALAGHPVDYDVLKASVLSSMWEHPLIEAVTPSARTFANALLPSTLRPLTFAASTAETGEYNEAISDLIAAAAKSLGSVASEDAASAYLREHSLSKLTGGLADTSIERLQDALATAWDQGGSYEQMVSAITETFDDFSETRAGLIAATESSDAYNASRAETAAALGYDEKAWETESGDPCPTCEANEAQGFIDIDEDFDSGDDAPTAHPNCLCVVNFRKSSGDEDEE